MAGKKKNADSRQDRSTSHEKVKQSLRNELLGKQKTSRTFIQKQLESISREMHQASQSGRNQGLRGLIAVYLGGLACFFIKKD